MRNEPEEVDDAPADVPRDVDAPAAGTTPLVILATGVTVVCIDDVCLPAADGR